jgi:hypothetical protein
MGLSSLIPSFVIFAVVIAGAIVGLSYLRRRARRMIVAEVGQAPQRTGIGDLVKRANIQLVQMDDAIRTGEEDLQFAAAEFGDESVHDFAAALETAKRRASEAFALKQRLDDAYPDSEQQQRDWSNRILTLSDSALALVTAQSREFDQRRRLEISAPDALRRLRDAITNARARIPDLTAESAHLAETYDPAALAAVAGDTETAAAALEQAEHAATDAENSLKANPLTGVARQVQAAEQSIRRANALLDAIAQLPQSLADAQSRRTDALGAAGAQLREAVRLRGTLEDADAVSRIVAASARLDAAVTAARGRTLAHPVADLDALAAAAADLDGTLAIARSAQQRLDSARTALVGAIEIATSYIRTAGDFITSRRGMVGADARTRLAEAQRQLALAQAEADPVAALDGARRSATLATDADALARYDASGSLHR